MVCRPGFAALLCGSTISKFGSTFTAIALPVLSLTALHASAFQVSLLTAAAWLPWLVIGLPAGTLVDRSQPRTLILACSAAAMLAVAAVPAASATGRLTMPLIVSVALVAGACSVVSETSYQVLLPRLAQPEALAAANSRMQAGNAVVSVAGPSAGGALVQAVGAAATVVFDALSYLIAFGLAARLPTLDRSPAGAGAVTPQSFRRSVADGVRMIARDRYLRSLTAVSAVINVGLTAYQAILIPYLVRSAGIAPGVIGGAMGMMSAGGLAGALLAGRLARRFGSARALLVTQALATAPALLIPLTTSASTLPFAVAGGALAATGLASSSVIKSTFRQQYCPPELLGRVTVSMQFFTYGATPLGALAGGALASVIGLRSAVALGAIWVTVSWALLLAGPFNRRRDLPSSPAAGEPPGSGPG
ncbi:hypothetical protein BIV57_00230 [Mangrovactinospora gilvigrisea]|uniref:Major facilitator superfamily (MFS) profile domain-containing protein n=2 Tax=Mangrovactinospora gilvigrisea TaxID=1428644 RepID=A0A1J7BLC9_9ACTN|nr:hypothetical protein BIV57_00230 [Mangrovactinospora gilvigrisea]